jgi:hypothetical protein
MFTVGVLSNYPYNINPAPATAYVVGNGAVYSTPQIKIAATAAPVSGYQKWFKPSSSSVTTALPGTMVTPPTVAAGTQPPANPPANSITQQATVYVGEYHSSYQYNQPGTIDVAVLLSYPPNWGSQPPLPTCGLTASGPGIAAYTGSFTQTVQWYPLGGPGGEGYDSWNNHYDADMPGGYYVVFSVPIQPNNEGEYTFTATPNDYVVVNNALQACYVGPQQGNGSVYLYWDWMDNDYFK